MAGLVGRAAGETAGQTRPGADDHLDVGTGGERAQQIGGDGDDRGPHRFVQGIDDYPDPAAQAGDGVD
jgi:hypothetical protein